jgi:transcriptional regulator NrdR family protein
MSWCPYCEQSGLESDSQVTDTRLLANGWLWRRRRCRVDRDHRWPTYEIRGTDLDLSEHNPADLKERRRSPPPETGVES